MARSLSEFRVRGVKTNIPFLENLIQHPTFIKGDATTTFIDNSPELFRFRAKRDRATKILSYLGDVIVNGRSDVKGKVDPKRDFADPPVPEYPRSTAPPDGTRQKLQELGPESFAQWVRKQKRLLFTDTTFRDAHQSLLATRVRTHDLLAIARRRGPSGPAAFQPGNVGRSDLRHRHAIPAGRPVGPARPASRTRVPNILFQMLLRASNAVGYTNYPDNVVSEFVVRSRRAWNRCFPHFRFAQLDGKHEGRPWTPSAKKPAPSAKRPSVTPATFSIPSAPNTA